MNEVIVSMNNISKSFPGVKALDHVKFELRSGEVMALLGENGAGKSTLMKILSGVYTRDEGTMEIFGKSYDDLTPKQAQEAGVAIIHQELNMCKHLTVTENMFLGREVKGATRWINVPGIGQIQPSELTKIGMIIFYAGYLTDHKNELKDFWRGFVKPLVFFLLPPVAILYLVQNHLSVCLVIGSVTFVMMLMAGCRLLHFIGTGIAGVAAIALYLIKGATGSTDSFRLDRIQTFFDPWSDATGTGYQMVQSLYAIGSGGLFGVGLGNSKQKYLYIPEPQNDFIFAIVAEELGFVGCVTIILLFAIFVWRGIVISMKAPDMFGSLLAIGVTTLVATQAIINIAVVTASIPTTGMALPFFSYRRNRTVSTTGWSGNFA